MGVGERERQVRRFVGEVWNGRNYQAAADLYGEDYRNPFGTGASARVEPIRRYHDMFPDLHLDIEELIVTGDAAALRLSFRGTDTGVSRSAPHRPGGRGVGGLHHALRGRQGCA